MKQYLAIIPARWGSSRLEGKPLMDINGEAMIQHVYTRVSAVLGRHNTVVATDNDRIAEAIHSIEGNFEMTSIVCQSGTDRVYEAYRKIKQKAGVDWDVIINVQGDLPLIQPTHIHRIMDLFEMEPTLGFGTIAYKVQEESELNYPNDAYVVMDRAGYALYFSRFPLPHGMFTPPERLWNGVHRLYKHIGVYGYAPDTLGRFVSLPPSSLEAAERLEQNRWLEAGRLMKVYVVDKDCPSVDTQEDLERVRKIMAFERI
jgi:3-deoxy-manno-octulosonate cytidylyltransferase (CMP-KDO synthetase)